MGGILSVFTPSWAEGKKKGRVRRETECEYESDESGIEVGSYPRTAYRQENFLRYPRDGGGDKSMNRSLNSSFGNRSFSSRKERVPEPFTGTKRDLKEWLLHFETCSR